MPIVNLWKAYQILREILVCSEKRCTGKNTKNNDYLLRAWWGCWILFIVGKVILICVDFVSETFYLNSNIRPQLYALHVLIAYAVKIIFYVIIHKVTIFQTTYVKNLQR